MSARTPTVRLTNWPVRNAGWLGGCEQTTDAIRLDSPGWFAWLEDEEVTRFAYPMDDPGHGYISGYMTSGKSVGSGGRRIGRCIDGVDARCGRCTSVARWR